MGTGSSKDSRDLYRTRDVSLRSLCSGGCSYSSGRRDQNKQDGTAEPEPWGGQAVRESNKSRTLRCIQGENFGSVHVPSTSSSIELDEWVQESVRPVKSVAGGISSATAETQSFNLSSHSHPQLSQIPGQSGISCNGDMNIGSSAAYSVLSVSTTVCQGENCTDILESSIDVPQNGSLCPLLFSRLDYSDDSHGIGSHAGELGLDAPTEVHGQNQVYGNAATPASVTVYEPDINGSSILSHVTSQRELSRACRQTETMRHLGTSMQFSQAVSSGRHAAGILRRNASVGTFNRVVGDASYVDQQGHCTAELMNQSTGTHPTSTNYGLASGNCSIRSNDSNRQLHVDNQQPVNASNDHPLLWRSAFLEQRHRVRSQVRALQRLGSRFESLVGHDRSCISSGHHQSGHCICRTTFRRDTLEDVTNTRASISRIVMLAEALFDVLDEIHQQSVVLASWPSASLLGSVPAPEEVVENLPLKMYSKSAIKDEEAAQCHICLVEYAEGDWMRILPCNHKFHQSCIDKWLKEIQRVCPLCRGNICKSDSLRSE